MFFRVTSKREILLFLMLVGYAGFVFSQTDSLQNAAFETPNAGIYIDTIKTPVVVDIPTIKKERVFGKNAEGRLQFNFKLPGRKKISWKVPKVLYPGESEFPDPDVSWQRSLLVPGWGQAYNGDSWKLPIIYAGYAATGWYYSDRQRTYQDYRRAYRIRVLEEDGEPIGVIDQAFLDANETIANTSIDGLLRQRNQVRRQRDYSILYIGAWHILSVVESFVGAHMKSVDITEDISIRVQPGWIDIPGNVGAPGMGLSIGF